MTRRPTKIAPLRTILLDRNPKPACRFATRGAAAKLALLLLILLVAGTARANTYYIDYASGSNSNNGLSKSAPWKSHPYMACGTAPTYTHAAGDQFILKGGVTWPASCFTMAIANGGSSSAQDYYGVDKTWFNGSSWTRPLWDLNYTVETWVVEATSANSGYMTFDNIEIAHQGISFPVSFGTGQAFSFRNGGRTGTILENMYIHDWASPNNIAAGSTDYDDGAIDGGGAGADPGNSVRLLNSTITDQNGYFFQGGTKITGVPFGGACRDCTEVSGDTFTYTMAACFDVAVCHDSEFSHIDQGGIANYDGDIHSQVIEDDGGGRSTVYNNYVHDNPAAVIVDVCPGSTVYNNVLANNPTPGDPNILVDARASQCHYQAPSTSTQNIYNNTLVGSGIRYCCSSTDTIGAVNERNNIFLNASDSVQATITSYTHSPNYSMNSTEASVYGFVTAGKYSPSSADPNTVQQGTNLTSSCSGTLVQLCQDTSGAPWFGGSYKTRPTGSTGWDLGAFQGQGGTVGPPSISISSPSPGTISGSVSLTASCTPQGSATVGSIQFTIDGDTFGAAGTASPYTLSWNTLTAANATHTISATCTDSNSQTGTASTVTVTVSNSMPGCFVSTDNGSGSLSWTANQSFTVQTANFTATFTAEPNTANQDSVIGLSQAPATAYSQMAALVRFNSSGTIDVYKGSIANYAADATVSYSAGTIYAFTFIVNMTAGTYTVALTSPSSVTLATNYPFRTTAPATSLGFLNAVSDDTTPDTSQVCGFALAGSTSLTFSPASLNLGSITVGGNSIQAITATTTGGSVNFTSVAISGNADFTIISNTCTGSVPSSCTTQIKFAPTSAALETATVTYTDDATGSPQTVAVSGTGVPATPTLSVNPASLNFGSVQVHVTSSSGPIVLTITSGPVTFTGTPSLSGANAADFALASNTCTGTVSTASCQTVVSFTPSAVAAESATLTYTDNATGSPQSVALTGTGYLAPHPPTSVHATVQ